MISKDQIIHDIALAYATEEYKQHVAPLNPKPEDLTKRPVEFCDLYIRGVIMASNKIDEISDVYSE